MLTTEGAWAAYVWWVKARWWRVSDYTVLVHDFAPAILFQLSETVWFTHWELSPGADNSPLPTSD